MLYARKFESFRAERFVAPQMSSGKPRNVGNYYWREAGNVFEFLPFTRAGAGLGVGPTRLPLVLDGCRRISCGRHLTEP